MSEKTDWKVFGGSGKPHWGLADLPPPPPWRFATTAQRLVPPKGISQADEAARAAPFLPTPAMINAVNAALYLRRPLLVTGRPGTGKSTLISKVAHELNLGRVLRWPITSRSSVRAGIYEYDAVGRLQAGKDKDPPVEAYLTLGPLGTALTATTWPSALLIDEIDKSDLDFANDLLNVIEEGEGEIPELRRLGTREVSVRDFHGRDVRITDGRLACGQFPFVIMTSNGEREFPPAFLRRCVRLHILPPTSEELRGIVQSHLSRYAGLNQKELSGLIDAFDERRKESQDVSTDQLLNAVFLTIAVPDSTGREFRPEDLAEVRDSLLRKLAGSDS